MIQAASSEFRQLGLPAGNARKNIGQIRSVRALGNRGFVSFAFESPNRTPDMVGKQPVELDFRRSLGPLIFA